MSVSGQGGGGGPPQGPPSPETQAALEQMVRTLYAQLRQLMPEAPEAVLVDAAQAATRDMTGLRAQLLTGAVNPRQVWGFSVHRIHRIETPDQDDSALVTVGGPRQLDCSRDISEVIGSATTMALASSALARAYLYVNDYRLAFQLDPNGRREDESGADNVVPLDERRRKRNKRKGDKKKK